MVHKDIQYSFTSLEFVGTLPYYKHDGLDQRLSFLAIMRRSLDPKHVLQENYLTVMTYSNFVETAQESRIWSIQRFENPVVL